MLIDLQNKILHVFRHLEFEEKRHLYNIKGIFLPSVSKKVSEHVKPFNPDLIAPLSALKMFREERVVITPEQLKLKWKKAGDDGCALGTKTHDYLEFYTGAKKPTTPQEIAGVKFLTKLFSVTYVNEQGKLERRYEILHRELRGYSKRFWYAGTLDLLIADKKTRTIIIADYKTNKDLNKTHGTLKPPFQYLESKPLNKYKLQLSYYQIFIEEMTGLKVTERWLIHLNKDGDFKRLNLEDLTGKLKTYMINKKKTKV